MTRRRVGIVGYGSLGKYLAAEILKNPSIADDFELGFVWNRTPGRIGDTIPPELVLEDLANFSAMEADLIVEVAHPGITAEFGPKFLESADYFTGSPTAFADAGLETRLRSAAAQENGHGLYVPRGALSCLDRVLEMSADNALDAMTITMTKAPHHLQYVGPLEIPLAELTEETVIFSGSVREVCGYAPNNVNTMAVAAMAAPHLGFDQVEAKLVASPGLNCHIIQVEMFGPETDGDRYSETILRRNPARRGAVTGKATFRSFLKSMIAAGGAGDGVHFR